MIEYVPLKLLRHESRFKVLQSDGELFGVLGSRLYPILNRVMKLGSVLAEPMVTVDSYDGSISKWKRYGTSARCEAELNIYSDRHSSNVVGKTLSMAGLYLQPPRTDPHHLPYENPQNLKLPHFDAIMVDPQIDAIEPEVLYGSSDIDQSSEVEIVLDHLHQPHELREVPIDKRIRTELKG